MSDTLDDILADVKKEGESPFDTLEVTPSDSPTVKEAEKPEEGDNTPDENVPFHKHPRWIERETELNDLRAKEEQNARELAELKAARSEEPKAIPDWFSELYGDNAIAWQKYSEREQQQAEEIATKAVQIQEHRQQQAASEAKYWEDWVGNQVNQLRADGHEFEQNEFMKLMLDYMPTDINNNLDFAKGIKLYEDMHTKDPSSSYARKALADTTTRSTGERQSRDYMTAAELRQKSWNSL